MTESLKSVVLGSLVRANLTFERNHTVGATVSAGVAMLDLRCAIWLAVVFAIDNRHLRLLDAGEWAAGNGFSSANDTPMVPTCRAVAKLRERNRAD